MFKTADRSKPEVKTLANQGGRREGGESPNFTKMIQACYFNLEFGDKSFDFHRYGFYILISHPLLFDEAIIKSIISTKALGSGGDKNASPVDWYKFSQHPSSV